MCISWHYDPDGEPLYARFVERDFSGVRIEWPRRDAVIVTAETVGKMADEADSLRELLPLFMADRDCCGFAIKEEGCNLRLYRKEL